MAKFPWPPMALVLGFVACHGQAGGGDNPIGGRDGQGGERGTRDSKPGGSAGADDEVSQITLVPAGLRRLTKIQLQNSLRDLLGDADIGAVEPDASVSGFAQVGASLLALSPQGVEQLERGIGDIAKRLKGNAQRRDALLACSFKSATDIACLNSFVSSFGLRAWRRPLADDERKAYVDAATEVAKGGADPYEAIELIVSALLQSPNFQYRVELASEDVAGAPGRGKFNDWEMASRLSFLLWNTTPDDELLRAAGEGKLGDDQGLRAQVNRLIASPRAKDGLANFVSEFLSFDQVDLVSRDPQQFPLLTASLKEAMKTEAVRVFDDIGFGRKASLLELFDTRQTFVNDELGKLYGVQAAGQAFRAATLPSDGMRAGLLGMAVVLALNSKLNDSSPTLRGRFVRETLLCQPIPLPPADANTTLPPLPPGLSRRELLETHRSVPSCASCHALLDPIGLALENYDAIGAFRTREGGTLIDASGELDGVAFKDARGLAQALKARPDALACLEQHFFRYATGRFDDDAEVGFAASITKSMTEGDNRFGTLVGALTNSIAFRFALRSQP